jgi:hypothetical protein
MRAAALIVTLFLGIVGLQAVRERRDAPRVPAGNLLYIRSGEFMKRAALSYDALLADTYWIRAVQHYGRTKLASEVNPQYDLLYPLLDLTTSLDPYFRVAYRFGAVFLAEQPPGGPGRADLAVQLLEKGLRADPKRWELAQDIGFVHYWYMLDYSRAADWFMRASRIPGSPNWLAPLAAVTLAQGGNRSSSRRLWQEVLDSADADWLRKQAAFRLKQLDAMDTIAALEQVIRTYEQRTGGLPRSWSDLMRAGLLPGVPIDSERHPFELNPYWGTVTLAPSSPLNPLPRAEHPA